MTSQESPGPAFTQYERVLNLIADEGVNLFPSGIARSLTQRTQSEIILRNNCALAGKERLKIVLPFSSYLATEANLSVDSRRILLVASWRLTGIAVRDRP